jgi:nucleoside-diphosphate-sugar epimerase
MRVLVTGGSGRIGQAVIRELLDHGYEVVSADLRRPAARPDGFRFVQTEIGDVGQVAGAMAGCDAVIHLAAIPDAWTSADEVVFGNNTRATFAVLQAATLLGVKKAVISSSISALGTAYAPVPFAPSYAPLDEAHPLLGQDPYALSKEVDERTGEMFVRRSGMQVIAFRYSLVSPMSELKELAATLAADPGYQDWWKLFWAYLDVRDAASACRKAIEADGLGFQVMGLNMSDTLASEPTEELLRRYAPQVEIRRSIPGFSAAVSIEKARTLLGWEPVHTWRD